MTEKPSTAPSFEEAAAFHDLEVCTDPQTGSCACFEHGWLAALAARPQLGPNGCAGSPQCVLLPHPEDVPHLATADSCRLAARPSTDAEHYRGLIRHVEANAARHPAYGPCDGNGPNGSCCECDLLAARPSVDVEARHWVCVNCGECYDQPAIELATVVCGCGVGKGRWGVETYVATKAHVARLAARTVAPLFLEESVEYWFAHATCLDCGCERIRHGACDAVYECNKCDARPCSGNFSYVAPHDAELKAKSTNAK